MARPLNGWGHEQFAPRQGGYFAQDPNGQPLRLPPPSSLMPGAPSSQTTREMQYPGRPNYYPEYATPSPVGQSPPHFPQIGSEPHPLSNAMSSRRPQDLRPSPTQSSTSDRSEDFEAVRARQLSREYAAQQPVHLQQLRHAEAVAEENLRRIHHYPALNTRNFQLPQPMSPPNQGISPRTESRPVRVSDLLANDGPSSRAPNNSKAPVPPPTPPGSMEYNISVRQQPVAARSCGFGERDRRVIDPPPIVQLSIEDSHASSEEISRKLRNSFYVVHCTIWNEAGDHDASTMPDEYNKQRRLMGTLVASPFVGFDENGDEGCFFCFPDLSCRTPGSFRLMFKFLSIDPLRARKGTRAPILATAMSEIFHVYNAKDFPGMRESTRLTKRLKEQGCLISIKKGNEKSNSHNREESDGDEDQDQGGSSGAKRRRQKK